MTVDWVLENIKQLLSIWLGDNGIMVTREKAFFL